MIFSNQMMALVLVFLALMSVMVLWFVRKRNK